MADVYLTMQPYSQSISHLWRTSILTNMIGWEQRSALYTWPRITLRGKYSPTGTTEINWLKRKLLRSTDALWGIPAWMDKTTLTAQAASGQKVMAVGATGNRHFYAGRQVILINPDNFQSYEVKTIDTLAAAQINTTVNLTSTWPVGTWVLPLYECRINQGHEVASQYQLWQAFELDATEAYETARTFAYSLPVSGADQYNSIDILLHKPLNPVTYKYQRAYDLLQFLGLGYAGGRFDTGENVMGMKMTLSRITRTDIYKTINFFDACQGRLNQFWVPSWSKDLVATAAIDSADTVIAVENIDYETAYLTNEVIGRFVYIQFPDGTYVCRKVADADDTTPSITLNSAIGTTVTAGNLNNLLISFLNLVRFDIDELIVEYPYGNPNMATMEINMAGLAEQAIEEPS